LSRSSPMTKRRSGGDDGFGHAVVVPAVLENRLGAITGQGFMKRATGCSEPLPPDL
jgi:hypothetical protein